MARGNTVIVSSEPRGVFLEGIIVDTSSPGTVMEIVPATGPSNGEFSFRARSAAAGAKPQPLMVLREDALQGKTVLDAYVANTRCFIYCPLPGEKMNMLVVATSAPTIGDLYGVNSLGRLLANNSFASTPFLALETLAALVADSLVFIMMT